MPIPWRATDPRLSAGIGPLRPDLNRAPEHELSLLPGLGPFRARSIVDSRRRAGRFDGLADLERVWGIGPRTVEGLRGLVSFSTGDAP